MRNDATPGRGLDAVVREIAMERVQAMSEGEILASLKGQGIDTLETLIAQSLKGLNAGPGAGGGSIARDTFIYEQFVYKSAITLDQSLIQEVSARLKR